MPQFLEKLLKDKEKQYVRSAIDLSIKLEESDLDELPADLRKVSFSFATTTPYLRSFGYEIIDVTKIDFTRLQKGASLLFNHDWNDYIGVVEKSWVKGNKAYATVTFDTHERAEQIYTSVKNGTLQQISVGYEVLEANQVEKIDGIEAYEVVILPHELSIVTVPADINCGIGRSKEEDLDNKLDILEKKLDNKLDIVEKKLDNNNIKPKLEIKKMDRKEINGQIIAMCREYACPELALEAIEKEKNVEQVYKDIIEVRSSKASKGVDAGEQKEFNNSGYSLGLAIKQLMEGEGFSGAVKEMNIEMEKKYGSRNKGSLFLPVQFLQKDVTIGNSASAGILKPTTITSSYIDALYHEMVLVKAGASYLTDLVGDMDIPRFNNIIDPDHVAENGQAADSSLDVSMVRLSPKDVTANMLISRKARMQTPQNLTALCSDQLTQAIRHKMDIQGLIGAGGLAPTGLLNQLGIQSLTAGTTVSWQDVLDLEALVKSKNAMIGGNGAYITTSKIESKLKGTQKANALSFIAEGGKVNNYNLFTTNALPSSGVAPATTNKLIFGDFSQMIIGTWGAFELDINRNYDTAKGLHQLVAWFTYDAAVKRAESFAYKSGINE